MASVLILSGGSGTRIGGNTPKQYIEVQGKPIIGYCLDTFQRNENISEIIIVASAEWFDYVNKYIKHEKITKFVSFAHGGKSRQHSILNGLRALCDNGITEENKVIIHDAARPCVNNDIIQKCLDTLDAFDCSMPVISVKDTVYLSEDGKTIASLLNRDKLYAGQAPEGCHLGSYLKINELLSDNELCAVRGTSAIAFDKGLSVGLFEGDERNYKITTQDDLDKFRIEMEHDK